MSKRKGARTIEVKGKTYEYFIGKANVSIKDETGKSKAVPFTDFTGLDEAQIARRKEGKLFSIKPKNVEDYITQHY